MQIRTPADHFHFFSNFFKPQVDADGELLPLNASIAKPAAVTRTWFLSFVGQLCQQIRSASQTLNEAHRDNEDHNEKTEDDNAEREAFQGTNKPKRASERSNAKGKSSNTNTSRSTVRRR